MIWFIAFSILYVGFFIWAALHWKKIDTQALNIETDFTFSVIIPVRNEEQNIQHLLTDLEHLDFPRDRFEVIFINDHSTDSTVSLLRRFVAHCTFNYQVIELADYFRSGKKEAITIGVTHANFEYILTTDADCSIPPEWITAFAGGYAQYHAIMITGPVRMAGEGMFQKLQAHEFAGLVGIGAASLASGNAGMCNGANLSYRRDAFIQAKGYEGNSDIPSGDDEFLLQKLHRKYPDRITFLKNRKAIVTTPGKSSLRELINQRIRWSSKWRFHQSWFVRLMAVLAFFNYLSFAYGLIWSVVHMSFSLFIGVVVIRWFSVYLFTFSVKRFLMLDNFPLNSILVEIIYPFFVIFLGLASIFGKYSWKGRHYT